MVSNRIKRLLQKGKFGREPLKEQYYLSFGFQNTCNKIAVNDNVHFSHYKSKANISCHSNQSSYPIGTKKKQ